ncbi:MAG: EAL domain-containing protein [Burkholderiaceae bacterium]|nr:EAL domain-containing protein [Burkholderiaceae bacterium]
MTSAVPEPLRAKSAARGFLLRLWLAVVLLNLLLIGFAIWALDQSRMRFEERAAVMVGNLSHLMEQDIAASVRVIDLVLLAVGDEVLRAGGSARVDTLIEDKLRRLPELDGLRVADVRGDLRHGTGVTPRTRVNIADRDYFVRLRDDPGAGLVVSKPVQGRLSGKWVINLARGLRAPDGRFLGVVQGSLPLQHIIARLAPLQFGTSGSFTVFDADFRLVVRHPSPDGVAEAVGMPFGSPELRQLVGSGQRSGVYKARSIVDAVQRTSSFRRITGTDLYLVIGFAEDDYLAGWREEVGKAVGVVLLFLCTSLVVAALIRRSWQRQAEATQALQQAYRKLEAEKQLNQTIIRSSPFAIYTRDREGIVTAWNPAAEKLFGWRAEQILGRPLLSVPAGRQRETAELRQRVLRGESILDQEVQRQKADGTLFDLSTTLAPLRDASGEISGYLAIAADITARKAAERQVEFLAYRDVLTGLPNRLLLQDRFSQAVAHAERTQRRLALLFLDLDNFKTINDSLGHAVGDALLKEIALRLSECVRETDTISRQGGDEFLIVLSDLSGTEAIVPVLVKIRERLQAPFLIDGHELSTSASIGVALYPDDGRDFEILHQKADTAMYRAKDAGRNHYRFFDEQMNVEAVEHLRLKNGLRRALERGEFELHYQPQITLDQGRVVGVEALLRWRHPEQGLIPPGRFIPVAEDGGLIVPIGEWVLEEACRQAMAWRAQGLPPLVLAVNLSAVQFRRGDLQPAIARILQRTGFEPRLLELELTESIMIHDAEAVLAAVRQLKQLGVKLSIDDFGTGYSSLSYLKRFDVDKLKIDQGFVRDLARNPDDAAIVRAIIQMAASLGLHTIAEGVEDAEALALLRQYGCHEAQGYFFARPMDATALADYVLHMLQTPPNFEDTGAL